MTKMPKPLWFLGLLVACAPETALDERVQAPEPPKLVAQRVTATVKREAAWLVQIQTEREALLTTPEHPFATPRSGWIAAGRLVPGDRVVSARFGTVRVLSVQNEQPAQPERVFNLSVDPSHAYVVGTDQVLVHNTKCKDPAEREKEIQEAERKLQDLNQRLASAAPEDVGALNEQIAEAKSILAKAKARVRAASSRQRKKALAEAEPNRPEVDPAERAKPNKGKDPAEREKEIQEAERELQDLNQRLASAAPEDAGALRQRIAQAQSTLVTLKARASVASAYRKRKALAAAEPNRPGVRKGKDPAERDREIREAESELQDLNQRLASSAEDQGPLKRQIARAKEELAKLKERARSARVYQQRKAGTLVPRSEQLLRDAEADYESRRQELETAQSELTQLLGENPQSGAEKKSHAKRRAALEKKIEKLQLEQDVAEEILSGEKQIVELARRSPSTPAEREEIAQKQRDLRAILAQKRQERRNRDKERKRRCCDDPEALEKRSLRRREARQKRLRTADYVADTERERDTLELLEEELAARRREAGSESLDERTEYLTERIAALRALVELRRESARNDTALSRARAKRRERIGAGQDTRELDREIARLEQEQSATSARRVQLILRETLLAKLDGTTMWTDVPGVMDEARVRELARELERELAAGGSLPDERLREIQHELGEAELVDAEFLEAIWREAEANEAALQERVQEEAEDVDALLRALAESSEQSPSPERAAAVESGLQALQNELREERSSVEAADFALANEHAFLSQTLGRPGSSHHDSGALRLAEVQQQRMQLRIDWRERMQGRLDAARQELRTMQGIERLRDETVEAELARQIALLEHEVNNPSF